MKKILTIALMMFGLSAFGQKFQASVGTNVNVHAVDGIGIGGGEALFDYKPINHFGIGLGFSMPEYGGINNKVHGFIPDLRLDFRGFLPFGKNEVFGYLFVGKTLGSIPNVDDPPYRYIHYSVSFGGGAGYTRWLTKHSGIYASFEYSAKKVNDKFIIDEVTAHHIYYYTAPTISVGYTFRF